MKKVTLSFIISIITLSCFAQVEVTHTYDFDAAGNRILRTVLEINQRSLKSACPEDSVWNPNQNQYYEELIGKNSVKIYPNPTHGLVTLQFEKPIDNSYYQLFGLSGQLLSEAHITGTTVTIDLSEHKTGVYMLTISLNGKKETWKIIKK